FIIQDFYFGLGGLLDVFRKDAQQWLWNNHYKKQIANGVAGWWTDLGEPEKHPSAMMHNLKDEGVKRLLKADEVHNIYGHYWNKVLFENYAKDYPNTRLFHLNRSGFAGSQRYSIFPWSGDVSRNWSGFRAQLQIMLSMSMSGIPYTHADAGGFAGGDADKELYVRWLQFASFTPIFRPHGTALYEVDPNAFSFPSEPALIDTPYRSIAKSVIDLRYAMLPYNYTLAYRQTKYGEPLVRPLYYQFTNDTTAVKVEDEFMWGNEMLVAPVLQKNATERKIYLPAGKWFDLNNNDFVNGNQTINYKLSLSVIPYFIKEGSFVPNQKNYSTTSSNDSLMMYYIPSAHSSKYQLYDDDGKSKNAIASGNYCLTTFSSSGVNNKKLFVNISDEGKYRVADSRKIYFVIPVESMPKEINIDGKKIAITDVSLREDNLKTNAAYFIDRLGLLMINAEYFYKPMEIKIDFK
ncbi:MAG TPA: TIM-barrel domain-containing protein, partial [Chitinophagaceae bacterium]|nr:TIM-barrel domain-containing protein [Chitinophagaceae bacterium]